MSILFLKNIKYKYFDNLIYLFFFLNPIDQDVFIYDKFRSIFRSI